MNTLELVRRLRVKSVDNLPIFDIYQTGHLYKGLFRNCLLKRDSGGSDKGDPRHRPIFAPTKTFQDGRLVVREMRIKTT